MKTHPTGLRHPVVLLCESFGHFWGSIEDIKGSFAVVLGSYANIHGSCAEGCNGTRPNSTCSLSWYLNLLWIDRALLRRHRALLRMYWVLSRMYTARVHTGATALAPIQLARWDDIRLFCGFTGLFCKCMGFFCECTRLACGWVLWHLSEFKLLVEMIHNSLVDT